MDMDNLLKLENIIESISSSFKPDFEVCGMQSGAIIKNEATMSCLAFHEDGKFCAFGDTNNAIHLIDACNGLVRKTLFSREFPFDKLIFTHHEYCILLNSTANDYAVRYLSMFDNTYLQFFSGHTDKVISMAMNPINDNFLTGSLDGTVRLWDLNSPSAIGVLRLPINSGRPYVAYDPSGLVFGTSVTITGLNCIKLYDARQYQTGPFATFEINYEEIAKLLIKNQRLQNSSAQSLARAQWTNLSFNADGKHILVTTDSSLLLLIDGYKGKIEQVFTGHTNENHSYLQTCFTPDSNHVVSGSEDGNIYVYKVDTGEIECTLSGHMGPVTQVCCSPTYEVMASGCTNGILWINTNSQT